MATRRIGVSRGHDGGRATGVARAFLLLALVATGCAKQEQPNVLLYVIDTLRADELEPYGGERVDTPAIQRFAEESVLYERAYAPSSWTRPSIASILTGLRPDVHGVETRHNGAAPDLQLLSEIFREAGYATAAVVTNPNVGQFFGFDQGYDDFVEFFADNPAGSAAGYGAKSDVVTARAIEWLESAREPFFLVLHTTDPHWPYDPPERFDPLRDEPALAAASRRIEATRPWNDEEQSALRALYRGEIALNDESFGELLDYLRREGSYDETVVVLTSDHGEEFGDHGDKGHGKTLFEEQVHVPLIIRRPGEVAPGTRITALAQLVDVAPTVLSLAGIPVPGALLGDVLPRAADAEVAPVYASLRLDGLQGQMLLVPPWKMIHHSPVRQRVRGIPGGLFDLSKDPGEDRDRSEEEPELARTMAGQLDRIAVAVRQRAVEARARRAKARDEPAAADAEMPANVRRSLEALGYIEPEE